jgi:hypothetical protein
LPEIKLLETGPGDVGFRTTPWEDMDALWVDLKLAGPEIAPGEIKIPLIKGSNGLVLSGALPRWLFAGLARLLAPRCLWLAIDDPAMDRVVVVYSRHSSWRAGDSLPRFDRL